MQTHIITQTFLERQVVVGHSHFIRHIIDLCVSDKCAKEQKELAEVVGKNNVPNAGVVGLRLNFMGMPPDREATVPGIKPIEQIKLMFGTEVRQKKTKKLLAKEEARKCD